MQIRTKRLFLNVHTEGSLLPSDLLQRVLDAKELPGLKADDYGLTLGETLNESINRSWTRLQAVWSTFRKQRDALPGADAGTSLTRRWLQVLFQELQYGPSLLAGEPILIEEKAYPISHIWNQVPIHLVSFKAELDVRSTLTGTRKASPHSLVQELLNRSEAYLWAFLSNGLRLRVLRDNVSLTRQAFVEFDLEAIFDGEAYADFRLLWLLCHRTRVEADKPEHCWLERWTKVASETGRRALDQLRLGVQQAIEHLGQGFMAHASNLSLRDRLKDGSLDKQDYYRQLLRLIYRMIFLFVAEDRDVLLDPDAAPEAKRLYLKHYSGQRLRHLAECTRGSRHHDLYQGLRLVFEKLGCDGGCQPLALPALGSFLFSSEALPDLQGADIANEALLEALRKLILTRDKAGIRLVDFRNLGSEELGSVYESLLELHPQVTTDPATFQLLTASGHERKTTGSYYTPDSLIQGLLDSALDPVLAEASSNSDARDPEAAILALKVCDPACGSGHFLIAAAHRIAMRLAAIRTGDDAPTPGAHRAALRDVIGHCLYGVDLNPMAVELCKVNLWLEALDPAKPLSFLDAHIQCGNSLLGTTPGLIAQGLPDEAFVPLEGDDKVIVAELRRRNRKERIGTDRQKDQKAVATPVFSALGASYGPLLHDLSTAFGILEAGEDVTLAAIHAKETRFKAMCSSDGWKHAKLVADAWCAAFVWEKTKSRLDDEDGAVPITHDDIQRLLESPTHVSAGVRAEIARLAESYCFLHVHIAFPHVFQPEGGVDSGFDVVLGNPPWERIKIQEKEWFAASHSGIAGAPNAAARKRLIQGLKEAGDPLFDAFVADLRKADGETHLVKDSGAYPLCGQGDINTYSVFAELMRRIVAARGHVGVVLPAGIATDDTTKDFFRSIATTHRLASLFSFENEDFIFPGVHHSTKFSLLTFAGARWRYPCANFVCFARRLEDLQDPDRRFSLSASDIELLNPNTGTCAVFRSRLDAELTKAIYQRVPVLIREPAGDAPEVNPWGLRFMAMLHMANDSGLFRSAADLQQGGWRLEGNHFRRGEERYLPLLEAKMLHHFDHRFGTYEGQSEAQDNQGKLPEFTPEQHADPGLASQPYYWVPEREVKLRAADLPRAVKKALEGQQESETAKALAAWSLGAALLAEGATRPVQGAVLTEAWCELSAHVPSFQVLDPSDLDPHRGMDQAEDCLFTAADQEILEVNPTALMAGEALLETRTSRWFIGWRDICRSTDSRTVIASALPRAGVGDTFLLAHSKSPDQAAVALLLANLDSFVLDFVARQKVGGTHLKYHVFKQLAVLPPAAYREATDWTHGLAVRDWMLPRILELVYTARDLQAFAHSCGFEGPPFIWDEERRFQLRCELDAAFFLLYGISEQELGYIMDSFPVVRRRDEATYGCYRTKDAILSTFESLKEAAGVSTLDPPGLAGMRS